MAIHIETRTKSAIIREHMQRGEWREAISRASRLPRLDRHRNAILDAQGAYTNARFYVQIGKDPDALIEAGKAALLERFAIPA